MLVLTATYLGGAIDTDTFVAASVAVLSLGLLATGMSWHAWSIVRLRASQERFVGQLQRETRGQTAGLRRLLRSTLNRQRRQDLRVRRRIALRLQRRLVRSQTRLARRTTAELSARLDRANAAAVNELRSDIAEARAAAAAELRTLVAEVRESQNALAARTEQRIDQLQVSLDDHSSTLDGLRRTVDERAHSLQKAVIERLRTNQGAVSARQLTQVQSLLNLFLLAAPKAVMPTLGGWAASAELLLRIVDILMTRRPKLAVECGSGASTCWLALVIRELELPTRIVALEHDPHYASRTRQELERHELEDYAEVRLAPLKVVDGLLGHETPWYDTAALSGLEEIGLLFVDGPPGSTGPAARLPAVPLLRQRLARECTIILDDSHRADESGVVAEWRALLPDFTFTDLPVEKGAALFTR
jgi:predicted O-methyltransferase YrrM